MAFDMGQKVDKILDKDGNEVMRVVTYNCMRCGKRLCECSERLSPTEWDWSKDRQIGSVITQKVQEELDKRKES